MRSHRFTTHAGFALASVMLLTATACRDASDTPDDPAPRHTGPESVRAIATPAADGSGQPRLAEGADGRLYLSWIDRATDGHALRFAVWEGDGWSAARNVIEGDDWFVNWADTPSMAALADGTLAAHWLAKSADSTYAYDVWLSVSRDGGASWTTPHRAHDDGTPTEHGFVSMVPAGDAFDVVWLDGRAMAEEPPGPMTLRHARLDRRGNVGPATIVDERVCECCPTDAVRAGDRLTLVYRDRSDDETRDIWLAQLDGDGWSEPRVLWDDGWQTAGCPVNGPAIAAAGDTVVAAWFTMEDERQGLVNVAFSSDGGRTFGAPTRLDGGDPIGRVDVVLTADGSARVTWLEQDEPSATILVRDVTADGTAGPARIVTHTSVSRSSGYPKLVLHDGQTVVAWTEAGETTQVRTGTVPD